MNVWEGWVYVCGYCYLDSLNLSMPPHLLYVFSNDPVEYTPFYQYASTLPTIALATQL